MFRTLRWPWIVGLVFGEMFILCVFLNLLEPNLLHVRALEAVLPGFKWLSTKHLVLGFVEAFLLGAGLAIAVVLIHNFLVRKHSEQVKGSQSRKAA